MSIAKEQGQDASIVLAVKHLRGLYAQCSCRIVRYCGFMLIMPKPRTLDIQTSTPRTKPGICVFSKPYTRSSDARLRYAAAPATADALRSSVAEFKALGGKTWIWVWVVMFRVIFDRGVLVKDVVQTLKLLSPLRTLHSLFDLKISGSKVSLALED